MARAAVVFLERAMVFLGEVKRGRYPNAPWLAARCEISKPTAHRVIQRLQDRFGAPLAYSDADRGFYLTDPEWVFPFDLCGQAEMEALLVATSLLRELGDDELARAGHLLWSRVAERTGSSTGRLLRLVRGFTVDRTDRLVPAEPAVALLLDAIDRGRTVELTYRSPWGDEPPRRRRVTPCQVRASDGALYLRALEGTGGVPRVFNLAFAEGLEVGPPARADEARPAWSNAFGVWEGEGETEVEVRIGPPGSRYFSRQRWNASQCDEWEAGDVLRRRFRAHLSPQLVRRVLSVGPWLLSVRPGELGARVRDVALGIAARLEPGAG